MANGYSQPQLMGNSPIKTDLEIGSMVEVLSKNQKPKYGVIRWLGFVPNSDKKIAGLELVSRFELLYYIEGITSSVQHQ